jgi:hypothetical protein
MDFSKKRSQILHNHIDGSNITPIVEEDLMKSVHDTDVDKSK